MREKLQLLIKRLSKYQKHEFISFLANCYWEIYVNAPTRFDLHEERMFATMASWLCFMRLGINETPRINVSLLKLNEEVIATLVKEMEDVLKCITKQDYMQKFVVPLIVEFQESFRSFQKELGNKNMYIEELTEKQDLWEVLQSLPHEACDRVLNRETETKYSGSPILKSLLFSNKLQLELSKNSNRSLDILVQEELKLKSSLEFHQIFRLIFNITQKNKGIIRIKDLDDKPNKEDIIKVLNLISFSETDIEKFYKKFEDQFLKKNTFLHDNNPFYSKPFYKCKINGKTVFICPSPHILLFSMGWMFSHLLSKKINNEIGNACEQYINDLLDHYKNIHNFLFFDLNDPKVRKQKLINFKVGKEQSVADFLIETNKYIFIVECKNSLGLRTAFNKSAFSNTFPLLLDRWNRIAKALHQLDSTKVSLLNNREKKLFNLTITNETVITEPASFYLYIKKVYEKKKVKLDEIGIVSLSQFENLIAAGALENFAEGCINAQSKLTVKESRVEYRDVKEALNLLFEPYNISNLSFWDNELNKLETLSVP